MPLFSAGQRVWFRDDNLRVYRKVNGEKSGSPILSESYRPYIVDSVLLRSYMIRSARSTQAEKVSHEKAEKKFKTDDSKEMEIWMCHHRIHISQAVREIVDLDLLKRVAEIIGYREES